MMSVQSIPTTARSGKNSRKDGRAFSSLGWLKAGTSTTLVRDEKISVARRQPLLFAPHGVANRRRHRQLDDLAAAVRSDPWIASTFRSSDSGPHGSRRRGPLQMRKQRWSGSTNRARLSMCPSVSSPARPHFSQITCRAPRKSAEILLHVVPVEARNFGWGSAGIVRWSGQTRSRSRRWLRPPERYPA